MKERDLRLDLIKLIAALMVVILHTIENGGGGGIRSNACICLVHLEYHYFLQLTVI